MTIGFLVVLKYQPSKDRHRSIILKADTSLRKGCLLGIVVPAERGWPTSEQLGFLVRQTTSANSLLSKLSAGREQSLTRLAAPDHLPRKRR